MRSAVKPLLALAALITIYCFASSPSQPDVSKTLVLAYHPVTDISWLEPAVKRARWDVVKYNVDNTTAPLPYDHSPQAVTYLNYIIDNYDDLPEVMFFHSDSAKLWHQIYDSAFEVSHLVAASVKKHGYISPRCLPGCENVIQLLPGAEEDNIYALAGFPREIWLSTVLKHFYVDNDGLVDKPEKERKAKRIPGKIAAPCCSNFAVSRERVTMRSKGWWTELRKWLVEVDLDGTNAGKVLEYTWHLWFGMEPML